MKSRTLALKLRLHDFSTISRRRSRGSWYLSSSEAFNDALALLEKAWDGRTEIRLLGLCFADLVREESGGQGELFADGSERERRAEGAVFEIERRGLGKVTRARLIGSGDRGRREGTRGEGTRGEGRPPKDPSAPGED
jgi:hypothetical protein